MKGVVGTNAVVVRVVVEMEKMERAVVNGVKMVDVVLILRVFCKR